LGEVGYLRIANDVDRSTVASILYNNGYSVRKAKRKKNNKTYEYYVRYELDEIEEMNKEGDDEG